MPRAVHVDAELETFAYRARLTERETPRSGLRTTPTPSPILPTTAAAPSGAAAAFCLFAACCSVFLDRSARDIADGASPVRGIHRASLFLMSSVAIGFVVGLVSRASSTRVRGTCGRSHSLRRFGRIFFSF